MRFLMILFALATITSVDANVSFSRWATLKYCNKDMGSDGNGWTLNSIGYNRGFTDVLKKLMDYKVKLKPLRDHH